MEKYFSVEGSIYRANTEENSQLSCHSNARFTQIKLLVGTVLLSQNILFAEFSSTGSVCRGGSRHGVYVKMSGISMKYIRERL